MRKAIRAVSVAAIVALGLVSAAADAQAQTPRRIVAVGDIHGSEEGLTAILQAAGLVDGNGRWSGGRAKLVQTGDYTDRGTKVRAVLDLLMRLEKEARQAGGAVEILLGNHEVMNLIHDFRDVAPGAFAAFADARSEERRRRAYRDYEALVKRAGGAPVPEAAWNEAHPAGFVEYVEAFSPKGRYGRWLRDRKVVVEDGGTIFMHAGLPESITGSLEDVNRLVARDLEVWDQARAALLQAEIILPFFTLRETLDAMVAELRRIGAALDAKQPPGDHVSREFFDLLRSASQIGRSSLLDADGPMWFRGFATWPEADAAKVVALLQRFNASRFVSGHTPAVNGIRPRFDNRVFIIDTGMLSSHYTGGRPAALEIIGETVSAIYVDSRQTLVAPQGGSRPGFGGNQGARPASR